jgi:hypothetical protein
MEAVAARVPAPISVPQARVTVAGLRHALGDCLLAVSFLVATLPAARELSFSLAGVANVVWLTGAAIMAVMSLARFAPRSATVNLRTIASSGVMLILPCFMRPHNFIHGRAGDDRAGPRVVRRGADAGLARLHGSQLRDIAGEPRYRLERAVSIRSSPRVLRLADTFDWLCDVLCERPQRHLDRRNTSLHGLANRTGRGAFECGSRVSPLHGACPVPVVARGGLIEF